MQQLLRRCIITAFVSALVAHPGAAIASQIYMSRVDIEGVLFTPDDPDHSGGQATKAIVVYAGSQFSAKLTYDIGWHDCPDDGGQCSLSKSSISNPEYNLSCVDQGRCFMPTGLTWDGNAGTISGTTFDIGIWRFRLAVRDRVTGEQPHHGDGAWWTYWGKIDGKTYAIDKSIMKLIVLAQPEDKEVRLTCSPSELSVSPMLITLDLLNGYLFEFSDTGKQNAIFKIDQNSDLLGWRGYLHSYNFTLDRSTGNLHGSSTYDSSRPNWHCERRAATRVF